MLVVEEEMLGRMLAREGVVEGAEETLGAERGVLVVVLMGAVRAWAHWGGRSNTSPESRGLVNARSFRSQRRHGYK